MDTVAMAAIMITITTIGGTMITTIEVIEGMMTTKGEMTTIIIATVGRAGPGIGGTIIKVAGIRTRGEIIITEKDKGNGARAAISIMEREVIIIGMEATGAMIEMRGKKMEIRGNRKKRPRTMNHRLQTLIQKLRFS